jgi:hypothetical protein
MAARVNQRLSLYDLVKQGGHLVWVPGYGWARQWGFYIIFD